MIYNLPGAQLVEQSLGDFVRCFVRCFCEESPSSRLRSYDALHRVRCVLRHLQERILIHIFGRCDRHADYNIGSVAWFLRARFYSQTSAQKCGNAIASGAPPAKPVKSRLSKSRPDAAGPGVSRVTASLRTHSPVAVDPPFADGVFTPAACGFGDGGIRPVVGKACIEEKSTFPG
jgi:hypothetical protein